MEIQGLYAAVCVRDMKRAEDFYTRFFGRGPDHRPMDGLLQWMKDEHAGVQIFREEAKAGSSRMTIVVPVMDDAREALRAEGLDLTGEREGDFGKIAKIADPDGNEITLAEPPKAIP